jgi:hypothetical protein
MEARFACGSMVLFHLFHKVNVFVKKSGIFQPAGGDIPRQTRDRLIHGSTSRFVLFAHVVLFMVQTSTA